MINNNNNNKSTGMKTESIRKSITQLGDLGIVAQVYVILFLFMQICFSYYLIIFVIFAYENNRSKQGLLFRPSALTCSGVLLSFRTLADMKGSSVCIYYFFLFVFHY
jgi:hypothetical protein